MGRNGIHPSSLNPGNPGVEPGRAQNVRSSVFQAVRVFFKVGADRRTDSGSSRPRLPDVDILSDQQTADARRAEERFVSSEGEDIDEGILDVYGNFPCGLGDIDG